MKINQIISTKSRCLTIIFFLLAFNTFVHAQINNDELIEDESISESSLRDIEKYNTIYLNINNLWNKTELKGITKNLDPSFDKDLEQLKTTIAEIRKVYGEFKTRQYESRKWFETTAVNKTKTKWVSIKHVYKIVDNELIIINIWISEGKSRDFKKHFFPEVIQNIVDLSRQIDNREFNSIDEQITVSKQMIDAIELAEQKGILANVDLRTPFRALFEAYAKKKYPLDSISSFKKLAHHSVVRRLKFQYHIIALAELKEFDKIKAFIEGKEKKVKLRGTSPIAVFYRKENTSNEYEENYHIIKSIVLKE